MTALDVEGLLGVKARIDRFLAGTEDLTGLGLYGLLEQCTPLLRFHTIMRAGNRNRQRNGLQQSYGDHNRLLLLGLDMLEEGNLDWYLSRIERPGEVSTADIEECLALVRGLRLGREARVSLWLGAALHDYGILAAREGDLDVENAVPLGAPILDTLCGAPFRGLVEFAIRNHDFIKNIFSGAVPVSFIARQVGALAPALRGPALASLGMIQVAGAASLGEGRLSQTRIEICRRCFDDRALADSSVETRLARLVSGEAMDVPAASRENAATWIERPAAESTGHVVRFLESVLLHGWERTRTMVCGMAGPLAAADALRSVLRAVADRWAADCPDHEHIVFADGLEEGLRTLLAEADWSSGCKHVALDWVRRTERVLLLNGSRGLILRG